ncbi:hypothetical protein DL98DRAFT_606106 [Cadophora sp. DSE1049]|nr:hypothetical protein DL98DRAFT_606106 [Cadophora sp. DSE1049]
MHSSPGDLGGVVPLRPRNEAASFTNIPLELHHMIFELTLVNPILGTRESIRAEEGYGYNSKYGFSSNLLLVNKQLNKEGTPFLYDKNGFYVSCLEMPIYRDWDCASPILISPITRYACHGENQTPLLCDMKSLGKARNRNVVPLRLLRNILNIRIVDALVSEVPHYLRLNDPMPDLVSHMEDQSVLEADIVALVKSNKPVEHCFEMYHVFLEYAQAFERYQPFRVGKGLGRRLPGSHSRYGYRAFGYGSRDICCGRDSSPNPFKDQHTHPVEAALMRARAASDAEDIEAFKNERSFILEYLEPQFRRLLSADSRIVEFIKFEKRPHRLVESHTDLHRHAEDYQRAMAEAMLLTEGLGAAMERDMPYEISISMRLNQYFYKTIYSDLYGGTASADLQAAFDVNNIDIELNDSDDDDDGGRSDSELDDESDGDSNGGSDCGSHMDEQSENANESAAVDGSGDDDREVMSEDHDHADEDRVSGGADENSEHAEQVLGVEESTDDIVADQEAVSE